MKSSLDIIAAIIAWFMSKNRKKFHFGDMSAAAGHHMQLLLYPMWMPLGGPRVWNLHSLWEAAPSPDLHRW